MWHFAISKQRFDNFTRFDGARGSELDLGDEARESAPEARSDDPLSFRRAADAQRADACLHVDEPADPLHRPLDHGSVTLNKCSDFGLEMGCVKLRRPRKEDDVAS